MKLRRLSTVVFGCGLVFSTAFADPTAADVPPDFWSRLALRDAPRFTLSVRYKDNEARRAIGRLTNGYADFPFIHRMVVEIEREKALALASLAGIEDVEVFGDGVADHIFHRLVELYRVYLYRVSDRFNISVLNFSQGVDLNNRGQGISGEKTIAEALEVLASKVVPVLVAAGDGPSFGMGPWAMGASTIPVVATERGGKKIFPLSARPEKDLSPWKVVLYADGSPSLEKKPQSSEPSCGAGAHLTADQMLHPEEAHVQQPGGSSFATFKAAWNVCYIHQYTEVVRAHLSAMAPIDHAQVEPFISYYVDSPVDKTCPSMRYRWADDRFKFGPPAYRLEIAEKQRLQQFVYNNAIEIRVNYSPNILKAFFMKMDEVHYTDSGTSERYVSSDTVINMLRGLTLADLLDIAANKANANFSVWKGKASADRSPVIESRLIDAITYYCRDNALFLALPDVDDGFLSSLRQKSVK